MKRLVIAIDCDDVLVPTGPTQIAFYNNKYNAKVQEKDFYSSANVDMWGTNDNQVAIDRVAEHTLSEEFANIPPTLGAVDAIRRLAELHDLHIVTGRPVTIEQATMRLVGTYFSGCFKTVQHTNYYTYSWDKTQKRSKAEVCRELGADIFIDDYIGHIQDVRRAGVCDTILFGDYGWSPLGQGDGDIVRCLDWGLVEKEINRLAR